MNFLRWAYFACLLLSGIYFGIASLTVAQFHADFRDLNKLKDSLSRIKLDTVHTYNDVIVETVYDVQVVDLHARLDKHFEYLNELDEKEALMLLSVSWGMVGGLIRLLLNMVYLEKNSRKNAFYIIPLLSCLTGLITYCITLYTPALLYKHEINYQPGYFMYSALLGGIFTKTIYDKLQTYIESKDH